MGGDLLNWWRFTDGWGFTKLVEIYYGGDLHGRMKLTGWWRFTWTDEINWQRGGNFRV